MKRKTISAALRKIEASESDKPTSIAEVIDKGCLEGATKFGCFSPKSVKRQLKKTLRAVDEEDFEREQFFIEFSRLYSTVMAPDKRTFGAFHPSQLLDGCSRAFAYELLNIPPEHKVRKISPAVQRIFDVGTWYHVYIQNILYEQGVLEQAEVPVVNKEKFIDGKADGVFKPEVFGGEKVLLEIKTMNTWNFSKAVFRPFKKHEFQASIYARELGATKVLYLYINKDTSEIREFLMPLNDEQLEIADKKMGEVIKHVKAGTLPRKSCDTDLCDKAINCAYRNICFEK